MGWFDTVRNALGFPRPLSPTDPEAPLRLGDGALARLEDLPAGHGIHVDTVPVEDGHEVRVDEGPSLGPAPPGYPDVEITASDADLHRMRGLLLDHRDGLWQIVVHLELRAGETPNPDGRLYTCNRPLAEGRPLFFTEGGAPPPAGRLLAHPAVASVLLREQTLTIERVPDTPWDGIDAQVHQVLADHFQLCGHALRSDDLPARTDPLEAAVEQVIAERVLPAIHKDGGDMHLVGVRDGVVRVRLVGACRSCPASTATLQQGVERTLVGAFPGRITRVEQV